MVIYKIENKTNGMVYIGQTTKTVAERVERHIKSKSRIGRAMVQEGKENFTITVLDHATNRQELDELERYWIAFFNAQTNGYNILSGGTPTKEEFKMLFRFKTGKKKKRKKKKYVTPVIAEISEPKFVQAAPIKEKERIYKKIVPSKKDIKIANDRYCFRKKSKWENKQEELYREYVKTFGESEQIKKLFETPLTASQISFFVGEIRAYNKCFKG